MDCPFFKRLYLYHQNGTNRSEYSFRSVFKFFLFLTKNSPFNQFKTMKTLATIFALTMFALVGNVAAQTITLENVMISSVHLKEGPNTVQIPNGRGSIRLTKRGDTYSNVMVVDATGKVERLSQSDATPGGTNPVCKCPIPDACFSTDNKNVGMCICKPCDLTTPENDPTAILIGLLLPAVQAAR